MRPIAICLVLLVLSSMPTQAAELSLTQEDDSITVNLDGQLFTRYLTRSEVRPALWPVIGPTGEPMTRAYPVAEGPAGEAKDHPHHRSVWVGFEGVNGVDFWHEPASGKKAYPPGEQRHREFTKTVCDGDTAIIVAVTDWLGPDGKKICEDERTWTFGTDGDDRWLDCRVVLNASEGDLTFADTKEGFFAVRVADSMNVDHKQGGRIINSRGQTDADAWAQPAEWVDYQGPVAGEKVGLAIFAHPESLNFPAPWHVRTYGLFAGNPLGKVAFTNNAGDVRKRPPSLTLAKNDNVVLHYRIVLHRGDENDAQLAEKYERYSADVATGH
jgi:Methane oxygenase PmoA